MKNKVISFATAATLLMTATSCIEEIDPQTNIATKEQVANAPGVFDSFVSSITSSLTGQFLWGGNDDKEMFDFGLPALWLERDLTGQDIAHPNQHYFGRWYTATGLGPSSAFSQLPWTMYYTWIKSCNEVISMANGDDTRKVGNGIAHAMRAYYYMDLARLFANKPYIVDKAAETVPIITETTQVSEMTSNPRATNEAMWAFIIEDLNQAETMLDGYQRTDLYTPDKSVVYGLKARAYLEMGLWQDAKKYAKLAQAGYTIMDEATYTSWDTGFNKANGSWMLAMHYKKDDPNILLNDADSSWGSMMCMEINPDGSVSGCGYAANYGYPFLIDRHLYETIPATDFRKKCYVDFTIDDLASDAAKVTALGNYSSHPDWILNTGKKIPSYGKVGGIELKFRTAGGEAGRNNQYIGFLVEIPMMRVEEMYLIEAEAAGRLTESDGIQLLTTFAKTRDASYDYATSTHGNESYYNNSTGKFLNEIWWQRRVELWGEGFAMFDIKRLQKGIIRSYAGTNHGDQYQWNMESTPGWMNFCIVQTETNYNTACTNNPEPIPPKGNSAPYSW